MNDIKKYKSKSRKVGKIILKIIGIIMKVIICIAFVFPFYWMITTSFKTLTESIQFPPTMFPKIFTFDAYIKLFQSIHLGNYIKNSLIILTIVTILQVITMVPAAYAFAKFDFKGKNLLFGMVLVAFMIPTQITFVSIYQMFAKMGLLDTLIPQIVPCICNAFGIFLLRQNFMQIPEELLESARMDEASEIKIMTKIMLPMSKSVIVLIMFLSVIGTWNNYFWPLVMTIHDSVRPVTIAIDSLKGLDTSLNWPLVMAGNTVLVLPILIIFLFASKKIISAMAYRGVK